MTTEEVSVHTFDGVPQREETPPQEGRFLPTNRTTGAGFSVRDVSALVSDTKPTSGFMTWVSFFPIERELVITSNSS